MFLNKDKTSTVSYVLWKRMITAATASPNGENYSIYWNFNRHVTFFPCSFEASVLTTCCSFSLLLMYNVGVCR